MSFFAARTFLLIILALFMLSGLSFAQINNNSDDTTIDVSEFQDSAHHWRDITDDIHVITPLPNQLDYKRTQIKEIADNILLYQKDNGGWPKNYDMLAILTDEQKEKLLKTKDETNTTFDNGATHSQIEYLAHAYTLLKDDRYKEACIRGIKFILSAQYPNGGFPQFYPDRSGYRKYITFNDGAMTGVIEVLEHVVTKEPYFSFVPDSLRPKITDAYNRGLDCILNCQIKENGELNVWGQQHDNVTLKPRDARTFEPACISNLESADIVLFLMSIKDPDQRIIRSVQSAVKWFNKEKIKGIRVETIRAPHAVYQYHSTDFDRVVVNDPDAPQVWSRYVELGSHRPLFCNRDSKVVYSLAEVDRERRTGYGWYTYEPQGVLNAYPEWQKKYAHDDNVLSK